MSSKARDEGFSRDLLIYRLMDRYLERRGYSDQELGDEFGYDRTYIYRIRTDVLRDNFGLQFDKTERGHCFRHDAEINHLSLSPEETLALYLAGRRLQQQTRTAQKPVANALRKLARGLDSIVAEKLIDSAEYILSQEQDEKQTKHLSQLMTALMQGERVSIKHKKAHKDAKLRSYRVSPMLIEPAIWGDGLYLIGYSDYHKTIAKFKLSRIQHVFVSGEKIPEGLEFDVHKLREQAWGIWNVDAADKVPEPIELKFSAWVTPRVMETIWHPNQTIGQPLEDGSRIWQAEIAEWREMVGWVRSWGSDVEVIKPKALREEVKMHVWRSAENYKLKLTGDDLDSHLLQLWGKTVKGNDTLYHPALYHMIDVAHVALELLSPPASNRWRSALANGLNTSADSLHRWLPWLIALHDIGKISASFQSQNKHQQERLEAAGLDFGAVQANNRLHHTVLGRHVVLKLLPLELDINLQEAFLAMVGGHHGIYNRVESAQRRQWLYQKEPQMWSNLRQKAVETFESLFLHDPTLLPAPFNVSAAIGILNGFTILCDWLGSDEAYFKLTPHLPLLAYLKVSRERARQAVVAAGFHVPVSARLGGAGDTKTTSTFSQLFHGYTPRPLQAAADQIAADLLTKPTLTVVEAPTGEGKTEFALTLARRIAALRGSDEFYVALPTMATTNAMFPRIQEHLRDRLKLDPKQVKLIHGQDFLVEDDLRIEPLDSGDGTTPVSLRWFSPKKRALLASFGVGTVDQLMLTAMNVKHNALRLIGLAGKVVILDEVHAYDTYMTMIVERLLSWLGEVGVSVILLSATLPTVKRKQLLSAYAGGMTDADDLQDDYPLITVVNRNAVQSVPFAPYQTLAPQEQTEIGWLHFSAENATQKAQWLLDQIADGGCACWITNTVQSAQDIYDALGDPAQLDFPVTLIHARMALEDRQQCEHDLHTLYGKNGERPARGIVIGTQVLEQSLDVDFDVMASDLAPVDLVLQREGRLHRHTRQRLAQHERSRLYVNAALDEAQELVLGNDRYIYSEFILRQSWHVLSEKRQLDLPNDYRKLIEFVYAEEPAVDGESAELLHKLRTQEDNDRGEANWRLIAPPAADEPFCDAPNLIFEEDEESAAWRVAQTRLGRESITVIPMRRDGATAQLVPLGETVVLDTAADRTQQLRLLKRTLSLSQPALVKALKLSAEKRPALFTQSPLLKHCHPLWIDEPIGNYQMTYSQTLGLRIEKQAS